MSNRLWEQCIHHRGAAAGQFIDEYFAREDRRVVLVGGAGFDPRSQYVPKKLSDVCGERLAGFFLREERPNPDGQLVKLAEDNDARIRELVPHVEIQEVQVFDIDNAPVGGRRAARILAQTLNLQNATDVALDCSALSFGVIFPLARYCLDAVRQIGPEVNFHILVLDAPDTDSAIESTSCGKASPLHAFNGGLDLDSSTDAARLWLPQLGTGRREVLNLIYQHVQPHAVSPIIPFPSSTPRYGDMLIEEYGELFERIADPMALTWDVDSRDIVYAHEKNPLDLYRSILNIADARDRVFQQTGGSKLILSPLGSKAVAVGLLMAALERNFAVVSVESIAYRLKSEVQISPTDENAELVHVWLYGSAYCYNEPMQEAR
jgi:hypothetical protein